MPILGHAVPPGLKCKITSPEEFKRPFPEVREALSGKKKAIVSEHAIGCMKCMKAVGDVYRNRLPNLDDIFII